MFKNVDSRANPVKLEHDVLAFWKDNDIFGKLVARNAGGPKWSFLDGPITANNPMGVHHAWGRTYKDCFQRYRAMKGCHLRYQNGFDCQGLWVEVEVEKELGFRSKRDIEAYGIENFVNKCKERVKRFAAVQTQQSIRLGYWMDWDHSYYTMDDGNNYAIWGFLKKCHDQGLVYKGTDCMPWCPRCGTGISQHEMHEGYRDVHDTALYVALPIIDTQNEYLLVWTTTPWTLVANVACAVNPDLTYLGIEQQGKVYWVSSARAGVLTGSGHCAVVHERLGARLVGLRYTGPFDDLPAQSEARNHHEVVPWKQVSETEGTGLVHIAPGCGKEDFELGRELGLPVLAPIDEAGLYVAGYGTFTGRKTAGIASDVVDALTAQGMLYSKEDFLHSYPHCWRCGTALLFRHVNEWFINMSWRDRIQENARSAQWRPSWGLSRELDWLDSMRDWMISKKRYWGLALPVFECACGWFDVVGSFDELRSRAVEGWDDFAGHSPHRPWIDKVKVACARCGNPVSRIPEVGNPWLDAGIVPYSTLRYGEDRDYWQSWMPADLVVECFPGQFRNWFYALLTMSTMMEGISPFKTLFGHALVKDERGEEMHKSSGNAIWFDDAVEKMGADVMRWLYCRQDPATNLQFGYAAGKEVDRSVLNAWRNVYAFFCNYARLDGFRPGVLTLPVNERPDMDRWILSDLQVFLGQAVTCMEGYDVAAVVKQAEQFVDRLSNWYVRRNRRRFWRERNLGDADKMAAYQTLHEVLLALCKALAPIVPFMTETMYLNLVSGIESSEPESVHLCRYPAPDPRLVDERLSSDMHMVMDLTSSVLSLRQSRGIRVRQPLATLWVSTASTQTAEALRRFEHHLLEEVNVKSLVVSHDTLPQLVERSMDSDIASQEAEGWSIALNTLVTESLSAEGAARDAVRHIQALRKERGFQLTDTICVLYDAQEGSVQKALGEWSDYIKAETLAVALDRAALDHADKTVSICGWPTKLRIERVS